MVEANLELDELSNNCKELGYINEKQEKRVQHLETQAIWMVTSYIIFQGIIFHSIAQQHISCKHQWIPFNLSLLIAIVFGVTFISTITKWSRMQYGYELNLLDSDALYYKMFLIKHQQKEGFIIEDDESLTGKMKQQQQILKPDMVKVYQRLAFIWVMVIVLLSFTAIILHACVAVHCK